MINVNNSDFKLLSSYREKEDWGFQRKVFAMEIPFTGCVVLTQTFNRAEGSRVIIENLIESSVFIPGVKLDVKDGINFIRMIYPQEVIDLQNQFQAMASSVIPASGILTGKF